MSNRDISPEVERILSISAEEWANSAISNGFTPDQATHIGRGLSEGKAARDVIDRGTYIDVLKETPGTDPVLAVADGHPESIPEDGWLLTSHVAPGYGGVLNLHRYFQGSFSSTSVSDTREKYGSVRVGFNLVNYARHTVAYENPNYSYKNLDPCERSDPASFTGLRFASTEFVPLENDGRLLDEASQMTIYGQTSIFWLDWHDWDDETHRKYAPAMDVNRVMQSHEGLAGVLVHLALGMGLEAPDARTLIETFARKTASV